MSRLSMDGQRTTEHEDRARILEAEFAILDFLHLHGILEPPHPLLESVFNLM